MISVSKTVYQNSFMAGMKFLIFIILFAVSVNAVDSMKQLRGLGRIARGHHAMAGQFPYMAQMYVNDGSNRLMCGAALIGTNWLLTGAHCFINAIAIEVYMGSPIEDDAEVAYEVPITNIAIHPYFNQDYLFNDIALLKIPPTTLCDGIGIVPLPKIQPSYFTYENDVVKGSGWGDINDQGTSPSRLQWGRMKILRNEECEYADITHQELCTAISSDWATICWGDSGGPLVLESTGELVGVASFGDGISCENGRPAIFTRVTSYLDWIKTVSGIFYQ